MKNKRLAIFLIIFVFLAVFVVLSSTIFSLRYVEVRFLSTTNILLDKETEIVNSGKFRYGESVFLSTKSNYVNNMEKSNPYLRVVNIETIFPNKFVINCVERNECFVIKLSSNKYAVADEHMKVLKILNTYQNNTSNAIEVLNSELSTQTVTEGDFFAINDNYFETLFKCFREWHIEYNEVKARVKSIQLNYEKTGQLLINMHSGVQIVVENSTSQLSDKLNLAFSTYDATTDSNGNPVDYTKSGIIYVLETETSIYEMYDPAN